MVKWLLNFVAAQGCWECPWGGGCWHWISSQGVSPWVTLTLGGQWCQEKHCWRYSEQTEEHRSCRRLSQSHLTRSSWGFCSVINQPNYPQVCLVLKSRAPPSAPSFTEQLLVPAQLLVLAQPAKDSVTHNLHSLVLNKVSGLRCSCPFGCVLVEENSNYMNWNIINNWWCLICRSNKGLSYFGLWMRQTSSFVRFFDPRGAERCIFSLSLVFPGGCWFFVSPLSLQRFFCWAALPCFQSLEQFQVQSAHKGDICCLEPCGWRESRLSRDGTWGGTPWLPALLKCQTVTF